MRFFRDIRRGKQESDVPDTAPEMRPVQRVSHEPDLPLEDSFEFEQRLKAELDNPLSDSHPPTEGLPPRADHLKGPQDMAGQKAGRAETTAPRRRIWDLENEKVAAREAAPAHHEDPLGDQVTAEDVAQARMLIAQMSASGSTGTSGDETNKTRILGFRAAELAAQDPFSQGKNTQCTRGPDFPVGWIVVVSGPGRGASFTLISGVSSIGRAHDQTICLNFGDNSISRNNHASVAYDPETRSFFLGQGGKSNIVRLNERPVLSTEDLSHGDQIRIGETTLQFLALCGEAFEWVDTEEGSPDDDAED